MKIFIFVILITYCHPSPLVITEDVIKELSNILEANLTAQLNRLTGIKELEKSFSKLDNAKLMLIDGNKLVKTMAEEIAQSLHAKTGALQKLVDVAEAAVKNYIYDDDLELDDVSWISVKEFSENDPRLIYSKKFKRKVNLTYSANHVPLEIYEGSPDVLNVVRWSGALDQVFHDNLQMHPDLHWQYFGSQTGLMRIYPATLWIEHPGAPELDLFDVRHRTWYVHAITSPKDIIVLMDTSGSMYGQTMQIMQVAVKILLQSLGEDDFVNVAWFTDKVGWVSCFETLVQANDRNKKRLIDGIDSLAASQMASLSQGLEFSFDHLARFQANKSESWIGAECHQIIALFSDGGTEEAWDVVLKWNKDKHVRIFSYAVGPHPIPYATIKELACGNRGTFTQISGLGSIRTKVQEYLKVLSRPLVYSGEKNFHWTNFYLDQMGLGLMTTLTLPVYNRTDKHDQFVVGVMGIDITLQEFMKKEPKYQLGPVGYTFAIDRNGDLAFHPHLLSKVPEDFLDDSPIFDLLDIEIESPMKNDLRQAMIDRLTGEQVINGLYRLSDPNHLVETSMHYYYTPLNETSFSLAIAIPQERMHYLSVTGQTTVSGLNLENNDILAPWKYCPSSEKALSLAIQTEAHLCNTISVQRLLWDRDKTDDQLHYWQTDQTKWDENVHSTFVMTEGGLTRVFPAVEKWVMSTSGQIDPNNSTYFSRSALRSGSGYTFMFPQPDGTAQENESDTLSGLIAAVKPVFIKQHNFKPAVAGVHLKEEWLRSFLMAHSKDSINCKNYEETLCYLVDDGGFVFASNHPDAELKVGHFLGIVDPDLMRKLYDDDVFNKVEDYNYKARCPKEKYINAGTRVWNMPTLATNMFGPWHLGWILDLGAWIQIKIWIFGVITWILSLPALLMGWSIPAELALELTDFRSCITVQAAYYPSNRSREVFTGQLDCNNCTRWYGGSQLGETNLFLVVSSPPCFPAQCSRPLIQAPLEDSGARDCRPTTHYRRRPEKCYKDYDDEGVTECSGTKGKSPSIIGIMMTAPLCLLFRAHTA